MPIVPIWGSGEGGVDDKQGDLFSVVQRTVNGVPSTIYLRFQTLASPI